MANWVKGTLKVRGEKRDVLSFFLDGIKQVAAYNPQPAVYYHGDYLELNGMAWIEGVDRGYIYDTCIYVGKDYLDTEEIIVMTEAMFDRHIDVKGLCNSSMKFNVDLKIYGFESLACFNHDLEIVKGEAVKDEYIRFDNYKWDCPCPTKGG